MQNNNVHANYLRDLGTLIKEEALEVKKRVSNEKVKSEYDTGYLMAMHNIISLMQQQALSFEINNKELSLDDIDPDKDLL